MDYVKATLLNNKNDLIEGTFCYLLFEEGIFSTALLEELIADARRYFKENKKDLEIRALLTWIVECVNQCFISHHDINDLFIIKNYSQQMEESWKALWQPIIIGITAI